MIGNLFQNDSMLGQGIRKILTLCGLNLLWLLCCLPVVTVGASSCGLYYALDKFRQQEDGIFRAFFLGFRRNFKQAVQLWMVLLILALFLAACLRIVDTHMETVPAAVSLGLGLSGFLLAAIYGYGFPLLARFEVDSWRTLLVDAVMLSIACFPKTVQVIALNLLPIVLIAMLPSVLACVIFVWVPVGFVLSALLIQNRLEPMFQRLEEGREAEPR